jgi:hypothetical protein
MPATTSPGVVIDSSPGARNMTLLPTLTRTPARASGPTWTRRPEHREIPGNEPTTKPGGPASPPIRAAAGSVRQRRDRIWFRRPPIASWGRFEVAGRRSRTINTLRSDEEEAGIESLRDPAQAMTGLEGRTAGPCGPNT